MLLPPWTAELVSQQSNNSREPWTTLLFAYLQQLEPNLAGNYFVVFKKLKDINQKGLTQSALAVACFRWMLSAIRSLHWTELQTALAFRDPLTMEETQLNHDSFFDFFEYINRVRGGLVQFPSGDATHLWDQEKARFAHPSIFHFFLNKPQLLKSPGGPWSILLDTRAMHRKNAQDCIDLLRSRLDTLVHERPLANQIDYTIFNYYVINNFDKHLVISEDLSEPPSEPLVQLLQMLDRDHVYLLRFLLMRLYLAPYIGGGLRHITPADVNFTAIPEFIVWSTDLYKLRTKIPFATTMSPGGLLRTLAKAGLLAAIRNLLQEEYLEKEEHDINETEDGESALYIACESGHCEIVQELPAAGACPQPDVITPLCWIDCETPLFRAILEGHTSVVDLLLKAGVDVNVPTNLCSWYTYPLQLAEILEHHDIVELLLEYGTDRALFESIRVTLTITETHVIADAERL